MRNPSPGATGTKGLRRTYFSSAKELHRCLTRRRAEVGLDALLHEVAALGSLFVASGTGYRQFDVSAVRALLGERTSCLTINAIGGDVGSDTAPGIGNRTLVPAASKRSNVAAPDEPDEPRRAQRCETTLSYRINGEAIRPVRGEVRSGE